MTTSLDHTLELLNDNVIQTTPIYFGEWEFFFDSRYHFPLPNAIPKLEKLMVSYSRNGIGMVCKKYYVIVAKGIGLSYNTPGKPKEKSFFDLSEDNSDMIDIITKQVFPMICINDGYISEDTFPRVQAEICGAFAQILPERSQFERF